MIGAYYSLRRIYLAANSAPLGSLYWTIVGNGLNSKTSTGYFDYQGSVGGKYLYCFKGDMNFFYSIDAVLNTFNFSVWDDGIPGLFPIGNIQSCIFDMVTFSANPSSQVTLSLFSNIPVNITEIAGSLLAGPMLPVNNAQVNGNAIISVIPGVQCVELKGPQLWWKKSKIIKWNLTIKILLFLLNSY